MPYKNIVFVKLEKRLLNDSRWWTMSESAQLLYVKLILLAAESYNKIPLKNDVLREALRSRLDLVVFESCIKEIENNFPKLKKNKYVRYFAEFDTKTNYIPKREIPRKSPGLPKDDADKDKEEDKDKKKIKNKKPLFSYPNFINILKTNFAYKHIDINKELGKMDAWLLANPGRQKTRRFIVNWLNKIDKPMTITTNKREPPIIRPEPINEEEQKKVADLIRKTTEELKSKGARQVRD